MFLDIHELARQKLDIAEHLLPGRIDFGKEVTQVEPLDVTGAAELLSTDIRVGGHLRTAMQVSCARCLEPVRLPVELDFDLFYRPMQSIAREEEVEIKPAELDIGFYQGSGLLLEDALKEQILLALPMKSLCRTDCAGLCPQCGKNRNLGSCGCAPLPRDDRWAPLAGLQK
jgi:uncharacterized protein